jgi:glycosyltransferase involved in cell wall biosynthesis
VRVAFVTGSVSRVAGGFFESVRGLAHALQSRDGVEVTVFGLLDPSSSRDLGEWRPTRVRTFRVRGPRAFGWAPRLSRALSEYRPDLLHLHGLWMYTSMVARRWGRTTARPVIVSPRGMLDPWALRHARWKKRTAEVLFEKANLRQARCIHALCERERKTIRGYGLANPVCTIPNGVEAAHPTVTPPPWSAVVASGNRVLLYLGRLHPKKNLVNLVKAWAASTQEGAQPVRGWDLVIIGWQQGGYERRLHETIARDGIRGVHILGPKFGGERDAALHYADGFVLPSLGEGQPMTVLEAWASGLPVLMTEACNLPDGFEAGAALRIGTDVLSMAEGIRHLASFPDGKRQDMGRRGQHLVQTKFTWEAIARDMHEVYRWLLGEVQQPAQVSGEEWTREPGP